MNTWHSINLGDGVAAQAPSVEIMNMFLPMFAAAGGPSDMAIFSSSDVGAQNIVIYFSPKTEQLAKAFNATPCNKPVNDKSLSLLCGEQKAFSLLFD